MTITWRLWKVGASVEALEDFGSPYAVDTHALQMINTFDRDDPLVRHQGGGFRPRLKLVFILTCQDGVADQ